MVAGGGGSRGSAWPHAPALFGCPQACVTARDAGALAGWSAPVGWVVMAAGTPLALGCGYLLSFARGLGWLPGARRRRRVGAAWVPAAACRAAAARRRPGSVP